MEEMIGRHSTLRRAAAILFGTFVFRSHLADDPLLTAIDLLSELYRAAGASSPAVYRPCSWVGPGASG